MKITKLDKVPKDLRGLIFSSIAETCYDFVYQVSKNVIITWMENKIETCNIVYLSSENVVLAYCLYEPTDHYGYTSIHAIYVKPVYRNQGLGRTLLNDVLRSTRKVKYSVRTKLLNRLLKRKIKDESTELCNNSSNEIKG